MSSKFCAGRYCAVNDRPLRTGACARTTGWREPSSRDRPGCDGARAHSDAAVDPPR